MLLTPPRNNCDDGHNSRQLFHQQYEIGQVGLRIHLAQYLRPDAWMWRYSR